MKIQPHFVTKNNTLLLTLLTVQILRRTFLVNIILQLIHCGVLTVNGKVLW